MGARAGETAQAELQTRAVSAGTGRGECARRGASADADARQKARSKQAELNLSVHDASTRRSPASSARRRSSLGQVDPAGPAADGARSRSTSVWVTANFKETQLSDMRPGQPATDQGRRLRRTRIQRDRSTASPAPPARASACCRRRTPPATYVKVVQRVPVKIVLEPGQDPEHLLRPGMSVVADGAIVA